MDIAEGADMVMVKPGMPYLDVVRRVKDDQLRHSGQPELAEAVARGRRRDVGDGWCWRRRGEEDISLLEAASLAVLQVADGSADGQVY